ncbi:MAG: thioesterase family protein [Ornithinimicrobium sp.]|uniref:acyl-CoA thioesterase n=1 Tax=Ornithinimicrobium sp. TaxID=1977084 RepID=UPI0026DF4E1B|nr:thioesterase family protein [Ornithinimicrobium sp.]MDO5738936.1 thioesterase family protein [Ornithinimicrobium sp.]
MSVHPLTNVPDVALVYPITVRWADMDAYAHVNNVNYLRFFEEARVYAFKDWFGQDRDLIDEGMLVVSQAIDYLLPMGFAYAPCRVAVWCSDVGAASFELGYAVAGAQGDDTVYARGRVTLVSYDLQTERPRRLGAAEREALSAVLGTGPRLRSDKRAAAPRAVAG